MLNQVRLPVLTTLLAIGVAVPAFAGIYTTLYQFTGGSDGASPGVSPVYDEKGDLYGTTSNGGNACTNGEYGTCGTLYKLSASGQETTLVTFTGANGVNPGNLTLVNHKLYGSADGGANGDGVLFSVHTNGTHFRLLHTFHGPDGAAPYGPLVAGPAGVFYGLTSEGGPAYPRNGHGVLFELMPDGTYITLYAFTGGADGGYPTTLTIDAAGTLYGSTLQGAICPGQKSCGVVFEYVPSTNAFSVLHQFTATDGAHPMLGSIGPDGTLYGSTISGGTSNLGTLFGLIPAGGPYTLTTLYSFTTRSPGNMPSGGPLLTPYGALIGTTTNQGALYKFKDNKMQALYTFPVSSGLVPPVEDKNGTIYSVSYQGGITPCATSADPISQGCGYIYSFVQ